MCLVASLATKHVEEPTNVMTPPNWPANDNGIINFDGLTPNLRDHDVNTGIIRATVAVLHKTAESIPTGKITRGKAWFSERGEPRIKPIAFSKMPVSERASDKGNITARPSTPEPVMPPKTVLQLMTPQSASSAAPPMRTTSGRKPCNTSDIAYVNSAIVIMPRAVDWLTRKWHSPRWPVLPVESTLRPTWTRTRCGPSQILRPPNILTTSSSSHNAKHSSNVCKPCGPGCHVLKKPSSTTRLVVPTQSSEREPNMTRNVVHAFRIRA
mmetsp:Transcript_109465/g.315219  ORF Transcript_109465/g.315219 Transcript_109465/m.315219 type:complete len:268 (-) Transcript_109465:220-1023(-)